MSDPTQAGSLLQPQDQDQGLLGHLFPSGQYGPLIGPQGVAAQRRSGLLDLGSRLLAGSGPQVGQSPMSRIGTAVHGAQEDWQKRLPEQAQQMMQLGQYQYQMAGRQAMMKVAEDPRFRVRPEDPPELRHQKQTEMAAALAQIPGGYGLDAAHKLAEVASLTKPAGPQGQQAYQEVWADDPTKPGQQRMTWQAPGRPPIPTDQVRAKEGNAQGAIGERQERNRQFTHLTQYKREIAPLENIASTVARVRREIDAPSSIALKSSIAAFAQLDTPQNARMAATFLNALNHGGDVAKWTGGGAFTSAQEAALRINKAISDGGNVIPASVRHDLLAATDALEQTYREHFNELRQSYLDEATGFGWYSPSEADKRYRNLFGPLASTETEHPREGRGTGATTRRTAKGHFNQQGKWVEE